MNLIQLAYCIHVYKQGFRAKHMPHATLGDKVNNLLLILGTLDRLITIIHHVLFIGASCNQRRNEEGIRCRSEYPRALEVL